MKNFLIVWFCVITVAGATYANRELINQSILATSVVTDSLTTTTSSVSGTSEAGTLRGSSGNAATPSLSFTTDTDSGLYRSATDTVTVATGGANRLSISTTAVTSAASVDITSGDTFIAPTGTAGAPTYTFSGDTDTGVYRGATNQLNLAVGGTSVFAAGIAGVATPTGLYIESGDQFFGPIGNQSTPTYSFTSDPDTGLYRSSTNAVGISTGGTLRLSVGSGGLVTGTGGFRSNAEGNYANDSGNAVMKLIREVDGINCGGGCAGLGDCGCVSAMQVNTDSELLCTDTANAKVCMCLCDSE